MIRKNLYMAVIALLISLASWSQGHEIPITTSSEEERDMFIAGRQKKENIQAEAADNLFDHAIELDSEFALAYLYRGRPADFDKANMLIDKVSEGEKLEIKYFTAIESYELKKAKEYLDQLLDEYPSDKHVHLWAGLFYENILQNYQLALDHFYLAAKLDENYAAPHNEAGYRYMRMGDYEKAEAFFRKYISLAPECPNAFDSFANFLMMLQRYDESIEQYKEVYNLDPDNFVTIARIGQNYAFRGEYEEARSYYKKYSESTGSPGPKIAALDLEAASYIAEGNIDGAIKCMNDYCDLGRKEERNIDIVVGTANMGFISLELGDPVDGLKYYQEAAEMVTNLKLADATRKRYQFLSLGWLSIANAANGNFNEAEAFLTKARVLMELTNNPALRGEYLFFAGYVDVARGNYADAIDNLQGSGQDNPFNIYLLAVAYEKSGDEENAIDLFGRLMSWENFSLVYAVTRAKAIEKLSD